jgi:hypothetical protein
MSERIERLEETVRRLERRLQWQQRIAALACVALGVTVAIATVQASTNKRAGLFVVDRARTPTLDEFVRLRGEQAGATPERRAAIDAQLRGASAQRVFIGSENETAMVRLRDRQARDRIRLAVDPQGVARLEFLDAAGTVVDRVPK